jgi:hypothetical protein
LRRVGVGLAVLAFTATLIGVIAAPTGADPFHNHLARYKLLDVDQATATPSQAALARAHARVRRPVAIRVKVNTTVQLAYAVNIYAKCAGRGNHESFVIDEDVTGFTHQDATRRFLRHAGRCRVHATAEVQTGDVQVRLFGWLKR